MRSRSALCACLGVATAIGATWAKDASACGGCFIPPETESVISDEKMMLSISKMQTTLYDEIKYSGAPANFAWVLPIKGTVTVGLSADILFQTIDALTATTVNPPPPPACLGGAGEAGGAAGDGGSGGDGGGGVTVLTQSTVGPYETVQLKSTDGSALYNWLKSHGYNVPTADMAVLADYVKQGFDFLAMKLVPGKGVQAMQPVRITTPGASVYLPMHMVSVGTGATTGITVWIVAEHRWEPSNFPTFTITQDEVVWDWTTMSSNYETLRLAKEKTFGGRGWQIESSIELAQNTIKETLLQNIQYDTEGGLYTPDASSPPDSGKPADGGDAAPPDASGYEDTDATADLAVLFAGISGANARITRMRSDVAHTALSVDMYLKASSDQSEMSNQLYPTRTTGDPCGDGGGLDSGSDKDGSSSSGGSGPNNGSGCNTTGVENNPETTLAILVGLATLGLAGRRKKRGG